MIAKNEDMASQPAIVVAAQSSRPPTNVANDLEDCLLGTFLACCLFDKR
jgi:hypothetical protein